MGRQLEIGDVLYVSNRWGQNRHIIDRVTPKRAYSGLHEFHREVTTGSHWSMVRKDQWVKMVGEYGGAYLETPELLAEWTERQDRFLAKAKIDRLNISKLSHDQVKELIAFIDKTTQKQPDLSLTPKTDSE